MADMITKLAKGAEGLFIKNERFNTNIISFNFYLPLKEETAALNALLPFILTSCGSQYPSFSKLNYKLNKLYGAELSASAEKVGDYQLLKMSVSVIEDRFTLDGEELSKQAIELLTSLIFEPSVEDNAFLSVDVEREKRKAIEHIEGEISEKRTYARKRLIEEMYQGEDYGVSKCGTIDTVKDITCTSLYGAWQNMLSRAFLRVNVVARSMPAGLFDTLSQRLSSIDRQQAIEHLSTKATAKAKEVKTVCERFDVAQGKLVMGFSSELAGDDKTAAALTVMCDIFGGAPYSRLFTNVREKMSLCYYCSASAVKVKGMIMVDSGVEAANADKAQSEILNQLDIMKRGEFSDFEFESSIKGIIDSLNSYNDSQRLIDVWYSLKAHDEIPYSPEQVAGFISAVSREDVIRAAEGAQLHTVYKLMPQETR